MAFEGERWSGMTIKMAFEGERCSGMTIQNGCGWGGGEIKWLLRGKMVRNDNKKSMFKGKMVRNI